jgi:glucose-6-phosphate 1-dehydrogenase
MAKPHVIVLFGATGDLARRKLLPGLLHLFQAGMLDNTRIVGSSLDDLDDKEFVEFAQGACEEFRKDDSRWDEFASMLSYVPQTAGPEGLAEAVHAQEDEIAEHGEPDRLHYLSVPPKAALAVVHMLEEAKLNENSRIIME